MKKKSMKEALILVLILSIITLGAVAIGDIAASILWNSVQSVNTSYCSPLDDAAIKGNAPIGGGENAKTR